MVFPIKLDMMNLADFVGAENLILDVQSGVADDVIIDELVEDSDLIPYFKQLVDDYRELTKMAETVARADSLVEQAVAVLAKRTLDEADDIVKWASKPLDELRPGGKPSFRPLSQFLRRNPQQLLDDFNAAYPDPSEDTPTAPRITMEADDGSGWQAFA